MKFLDCFLHDPLPGPEAPAKYDCAGAACVWIGEDKRPVVGVYEQGQILPLLELSELELEQLACEIITGWGDPNAEPEYSTRHPSFGTRHNLLLYKVRSRTVV